MAFAEDNYENSVIQLFVEMGYRHLYGPEVERDYRSPLFDAELEDSIRRINPCVPEDAIQDALFRLRNIEIGELAQKNEVFMDYLQNGIAARYYENGEEHSSEFWGSFMGGGRQQGGRGGAGQHGADHHPQGQSYRHQGDRQPFFPLGALLRPRPQGGGGLFRAGRWGGDRLGDCLRLFHSVDSFMYPGCRRAPQGARLRYFGPILPPEH